MAAVEILKDFLKIFIITFIVSAAVSYIYNLIFHSEGVFELPTAFRFAITLGIVFSWLHYREKKK